MLSFDDELFLDAEDELGLLPRSNLMPRISKRGVSCKFTETCEMSNRSLVVYRGGGEKQ